MNTSAFGVEKGVLLKLPATANLMIDSNDAGLISSPWSFQITKNQPLINGYFTRIGATEMVLEWCRPNISADASNNWITVVVQSNIYPATAHTITVTPGFYNAKQMIDTIISEINDISGGAWGGTLSFVQYVDGWAIDVSGAGAQVYFEPSQLLLPQVALIDLLGIHPQDQLADRFTFECLDLRRYRYLDFVSEVLTSVQDVKDASTQRVNRDVLLRWYFAEDVPENLDGYGFPILQGYTPFVRRRLYNPPKQIKWEQNLQVGNITFAVYDEAGQLLPDESDESEWLMTLQLTEG